MHPDFDWNDYVLATIAFLQKDRAAFDLHRSSLKGNASKSPLNAANVAAIERLALCFEKAYAAAYACNAPKPGSQGSLAPYVRDNGKRLSAPMQHLRAPSPLVWRQINASR